MPRKKKVTITAKIKEYILTQLEQGRTLVSICLPDDMPTHSGIQKLIRSNKEFAKDYRMARVNQMHLWKDQMIDLSKAPPPTGEKIAINAEMQRRRLEIDTMKFITSKLAPNLIPEDYGDKLTVEHEHNRMEITVTNFADIPIEKKIEGRVIDVDPKKPTRE